MQHLVDGHDLAVVIGVSRVAVSTAQMTPRGSNKNCGKSRPRGLPLDAKKDLIDFKRIDISHTFGLSPTISPEVNPDFQPLKRHYKLL